jgi:hypothetical protein
VHVIVGWAAYENYLYVLVVIVTLLAIDISCRQYVTSISARALGRERRWLGGWGDRGV